MPEWWKQKMAWIDRWLHGIEAIEHTEVSHEKTMEVEKALTEIDRRANNLRRLVEDMRRERHGPRGDSPPAYHK